MKHAVLCYLGDATGTDYPLALYSLRGSALADAAVALSFRITVRVFPHGTPSAVIARALFLEEPDLVGFSAYVWNIAATLAAGAALHRLLPELPVVMGGPEVHPRGMDLLKSHPWLAGVAQGEAEEAFTAWLRAGGDGAGLREVPGWVVRGPEGSSVSTGPSPPVSLESLPPLYGAPNGAPVEEGGPVLMETSRGCPFVCRFCYWSGESLGAKMRYLPLDTLEEALEAVFAGSPRELFLIDAELNSTLDHAREVLLRVVKVKKRHPGSARTVVGAHLLLGVGRIDAPLARLLKEAGVRIIIGIQSLNPEALRRMRRGWSRLDRFREELALLEEAGNTIYNFDLIYGLPGDDLGRFREGCRQVLDKGYRLWTGPLLLLPGTHFREEAASFSLVGAPDPPYEVLASDGWTVGDLERARCLQGGIDGANRLGMEPFRAAAATLGMDVLDLLEEVGGESLSGGEKRGPLLVLGELLAKKTERDPRGRAWGAGLVEFWENLRRARPLGGPPGRDFAEGEVALPKGALRVRSPVMFREFQWPLSAFRFEEGRRGVPEASRFPVVALFSPALAAGVMEVSGRLPGVLRSLDQGRSLTEAVGAAVGEDRGEGAVLHRTLARLVGVGVLGPL